MRKIADYIHQAARQGIEIAAETLWPTRCALCNREGDVICDICKKKLPYIDSLRSCRRCGSPFGSIQCDYCNPVTLDLIHLDEVPFASCASVVTYSNEVGRLIKTYKDQGEQRLASFIARCMACYISPFWKIECIAYVPSSENAFLRRGFDHCELLARSLSDIVNIPVMMLLDRPKTADQRALSGKERVENLKDAFTCKTSDVFYEHILVIDDVFTGGATICNAAKALVGEVSRYVHAVTFARVTNNKGL